MPRVSELTSLGRKAVCENYHFEQKVSSQDKKLIAMMEDHGNWFWVETPRWDNKTFSAAHKAMIKMMKLYLLAYIISGAAGTGSNIWPERIKTWLSDKMQIMWTEIASR